jgi:membrane-associated phospholipid phosphatase
MAIAHRTATRMRATAGLFALVAFATLTFAVATSRGVTAFDLSIVMWTETHRVAWVTSLMVWMSRLGGPSIISAYAALLLFALVLRGHLRMAAGVAMVVYGGLGLNVAVKHLVHRGRPAGTDALVHLVTYSYPSGHAAAATIFGGVLSTLLLARARRGASSIAGIVALILWISAVCASRVYLGAHYPTDVVAGVLEGIGWLVLATLALRHWRVVLAWPRAAGIDKQNHS